MQAKRSHAVIVLTVPVIVAFKTVTGLGPDHYCVVESRDCPRAILFNAMMVLGPDHYCGVEDRECEALGANMTMTV